MNNITKLFGIMLILVLAVPFATAITIEDFSINYDIEDHNAIVLSENTLFDIATDVENVKTTITLTPLESGNPAVTYEETTSPDVFYLETVDQDFTDDEFVMVEVTVEDASGNTDTLENYLTGKMDSAIVSVVLESGLVDLEDLDISISESQESSFAESEANIIIHMDGNNENIDTGFCDISFSNSQEGRTYDSINQQKINANDNEIDLSGSLTMVDVVDVTASCTDLAGNGPTEVSTTITVEDRTAPSFSEPVHFSTFEDGEIYNANDVSTTLYYGIHIDEANGIASATITYNDTVFNLSSSLTFGEAADYYLEVESSEIEDLVEGENVFVFTATDESGNTATETVTFQVDTTSPELTIEYPETISAFSELSNIIVTATDEIAQVDECSIVLDDRTTQHYSASGSRYNLETFGEDESGSATSDIDIDKNDWNSLVGTSTAVEATHSFYVECVDTVGNEILDTFEITFEEGFDFEVESPEDYESFGSTYSDETSTQTITLTVQAEGFTSSVSTTDLEFEVIKEDGSSETCTSITDNGDHTFSCDYSLAGFDDQELAFLAIYTNPTTSEETQVSSTFYVDTVGGKVSGFEGPFSDVTDASNETNWTWLQTGVGYEFTIDTNEDKPYQITATIEGSAGHSQEEVISMNDPSNNVFTITFDSEHFDASDIESFYVDINFAVIDNAGNTMISESSENYGAVFDDQAPTISSISCSDITTSGSQDCTCEATDNAEDIQPFVFGSEGFPERYLSVETTVSIDTVDISSAGEKTATCTATDAAGNEATQTTTFTVSAPASSSSGGGGGGGSSSRAACNDNRDNDGDGLVDMDDPGCQNSSDDSEVDVVCRESWICGDWSICSADGNQERSCYDANACESRVARGLADRIETSAMPDESRSCTPVVAEEQESVELTETATEETTQGIESESNQITGSVTGGFLDNAKGLAKPAVVLFSIAVIVGLGVFVRKKWF